MARTGIAGRAKRRTRRSPRGLCATGVAALAAVLGGLIAGDAPPARAQEARRPFDRLELTLAGLADVGGDDDFHTYWRRGRGLALEAATPFHAGAVSLGARFVHFAHNDAAAGSGVPSSNAWGLWSGWWMGRDLGGGLRASLGASLGFTQWVFADGTRSEGVYETEVGVEAGVRLAFALTPRWAVAAAGSLQHTYTHDRIDLFFVSAGVSRTFGMPRRLREVLE